MSVHMPRICVTGGVALVGRQVLGVEHLGDEAERRQRVPQIVHEHRDVVAALRLEHALQAEGLERGAHAREELARVDGLREVRVGALLQARLDRVRLAPRRRQHDDRRAAAAARAQALAAPRRRPCPGIDTSSRTSSGSRSSTLRSASSAARAPSARGGRPR